MSHSSDTPLERLKEEIQGELDLLEYNIVNVVKGVLWDTILAREKKFKNCDLQEEIRKLISTVFQTSFHNGPEDESFPDYDRKKIEPIISKIRELIKEEKG